MIEMTSPIFIGFAIGYCIFLYYVVKNFWRDMDAHVSAGMNKKEARAAVHKDYYRGLINPKHKMFPCGLFMLALFIYWIVAGISS